MITKLSKRICAAACALFMVSLAGITAFAQSDYNNYYAVIDDADYFSEQEFSSLCERAQSAGEKAGFQVAVHTSENSIDSNSMDSYYNSYHDSESAYMPDGVMLVFDVTSDNRIILTYGSAEAYFSDERMNDLKSSMKGYLSSGDFYNASLEFISRVENYVASGVPDDGDYSNIVETPQNYQKSNKLLYSLTHYGWIGAVGGIIVGILFVVIEVARYKHNGKGNVYNLSQNSELKLLDKQDVFLHKHTSFTVISNSSGGSGGSSGGGSSSHGSSGSF